MLVVEALEIDLVEIDPGPDEIEHARRAVAVGDVTPSSSPAARASLKIATAHSLVISGSL